MLRSPTLEHTIRTGTARFQGKDVYIASTIVAISDGKTLEDEIISHDGAIFTRLNLLRNYATISRRKKLPHFYDVRKYALYFADCQSLYTWLTNPNATYTLIGTEEVEGTTCYVVERARTFLTPDGRRETSRGRCWIALEKGFLVKKAILFDIKSPGRPLTITKCSLTQVAKGIWYYSKISFESYPLSLSKPDINVVVEFENIAVNQQLEANAFTVLFPRGCFINNQVTGKKYKVGQE